MDGYTVDEAAEVLGIPGKRVWELITTGVLAASSEGRSGMRVFLQPRSTTEMESAGGESRGSDATPFRELLTEFRNLTERYGQALLALGEARGEVASLRGRVDLLEARIDVRHAPARIAPVGSWPSAPSPDDEQEAGLDEISGLAPPAAEQMVEIDAGDSSGTAGSEVSVTVPSPEKSSRRSRRRSRPRSGHTALADIPAALARAEDPNAAEVRAAAEAEAAAERDRAESFSAEIAVAADAPGETAQAVAEPADASLEAIAAPWEAEPIAAEEQVADDRAVLPEEEQVADDGAVLREEEQVADDRAVVQEERSESEAEAPAAIAIPPQAEWVGDAEEYVSDDRPEMPEGEPSEPEGPLFDEASPYTTAFEEPDWIIEEDLWRSVVQAGTSQPEADGDGELAEADASGADVVWSAPEPEHGAAFAAQDSATEPSPRAEVVEPEAAEPTWASEPAPEATTGPWMAAADEDAGSLTTAVETEVEAEREPEPSTTAEQEAAAEQETTAELSTADATARPEASAIPDGDGTREPQALDSLSGEVGIAIGETEPEASQVDESEPEAPQVNESEPEAPQVDEAKPEAEPVEEAPEPIGDLDSFMAAAGFGSSPSVEPNYDAELEQSTAGWHSVIAPTGVQSDARIDARIDARTDAQDPAASVETEEPSAQADETATTEPKESPPSATQSGDSAADNWDASEMEAIRALLARANAIDRAQLEVEATSHPLEPDQEESVREIVASGAATAVGSAVEEPAAETPDLPDGEELIVDLGSPETAPPDEPPLSLAPSLELPGSDDLDEAMAALDAIRVVEEPDGPARGTAAPTGAAPLWPEAERRAWSGASPETTTAPAPNLEPDRPSGPTLTGGGGEEVLAHLDFGPLSLNPPAPTRGRPDAASAPSADGDEWLEPRDSAASRAFRRLRRIFPG